MVFDPASPRQGFDLVIGNPPWERIKLQEKEWFAVRSPEVAAAVNAAERALRIAELKLSDPDLPRAFEEDLRAADAESRFVRESARFPLCGRGDVNTYTLFTELARSLIASHGRVGVIIPSGIATDATTQFFFQDLIASHALASLYDFQNSDRLFFDVGHRRSKFSLLTLVGEGESIRAAADFCFFARDPRDLAERSRRFSLVEADFALLNPNTKTCPVFRSSRDAELTKAIYRRVPILWDETREDGNPWCLSFGTMFHMSNDSELFVDRERAERDGWRLEGNCFVKGEQVLLPLYEAKMIHHFDHRYGDYRMRREGSEDTQLPDVPLECLKDPNYEPLPRYWVPAPEVASRLCKTTRSGTLEWEWPHPWLLGWRDICRSTDERTVIASVIPRVGCGDKFLLMFPAKVDRVHCLLAMLNSFIFDYGARQKVGGTNLKFFTMKQLPTLPPERFDVRAPWSDSPLHEWIRARVNELVVSARAVAPFGDRSPDCYLFDPERRVALRCELDAAFFHLYGLAREDVYYVMDTFPIVRKHDEKEHGEYRTKRLILENYDEMAHASRRP